MQLPWKKAPEPSEVEGTNILPELHNVELFEGLPDEALAKIAALAVPVYAYPGQTLIEEGEPGREIYLILSGKVKVQIESITPYVEVGITKLTVGDVLGEMALLGDDPRSATVVAIEPTDLAQIRADHLMAMVKTNPLWEAAVMRNLSSVLARRLRWMNRRLVTYVRSRYF